MAVDVASVTGQGAGGAAAIRAVGLVKTFGSIRAVDDVTFELAPGRIYGLLGPNGSGKTTLIRLLTGLARATAGRAEVLGVTMPSRAVLARIGYMTQSDGIYPALTVGENARFFAAVYGVRDDATGPCDALRLVDLADRVDSDGGNAVGRPAAAPLARLRARPPAAGPLPRRADRRHRPPPPGRVLGALPRRSPRPARRSSSRATSWTRPTAATSSSSSGPGRSSPAGRGGEVRAQAGTTDLEQAFLRLGGDVEVTR